MIRFLYPLGLTALLALTVPLVIHLLSRKPGKTVKVGSIRLLESSESRRLKSLRLTDVPLLLLRAFLLIALALLLAQPVWIEKKNGAQLKPTGWILIAPELLGRAPDREVEHLVDSLLALGNEFHLLAANFPSLKMAAGGSLGDLENNSNEPLRLWSLLREIDAALPVNTPLWVFASDRLAFIRGERPVLKRNVELHLVESGGNPAGDRSDFSVRADSITITILYDHQRQEEARYVQSGLETVAEFGRMPVAILAQPLAERSEPIRYGDWIFRLSARPIPQDLLRQVEQGACLLSDAAEQEYERVESVMLMDGQSPGAPPRLERRVAAKKIGAALWTDGFGEPLLECASIGKGRHYLFHSRFNPAWNELVLDAKFPEWLFSLLTQRDGAGANGNSMNYFSDLRHISSKQAQPKSQAVKTAPTALPASTSLHFPLLMFVAVLFACERWWSERKSA
jgi:hypothetical protein